MKKSIVGLLALLALAIANMARNILSSEKVKVLVEETILSHQSLKGVNPLMVRAMIEIESGRNAKAVRYEPHLDDSSIGLMQTLHSTAVWLAKDMGYDFYGIPTLDDLLKPEVSVYFGCAYVKWLSTWGGAYRSEMWIVESYNGGPNNSNAQTERHFMKYQKAKKELD